MSSELAIRVENVGKRYRIGATQGVGRYRSLREEIVDGHLDGAAPERRTNATSGP